MSRHLLAPAAVAAALALSACATPPATADADAGGMCNADAVQSYLGKPADEATVQAVLRASGAKTLRQAKPGQAMTMDYREDRLNVFEDAAGRIERISCG